MIDHIISKIFPPPTKKSIRKFFVVKKDKNFKPSLSLSLPISPTFLDATDIFISAQDWPRRLERVKMKKIRNKQET